MEEEPICIKPICNSDGIKVYVTRAGLLRCAVKLFDKTRLPEFDTEIKILNRLGKHPNVINIIEVVQNKNIKGYKMDLADCDLMDLLLSEPKKYEEERFTIPIFKKVATGLEYIHSKNILHRDIKPENILMYGNNPKICDFNLSVELKKDQCLTRRCGSTVYLAPEQVEGSPYGYPVDIWKMGVLLFGMLTSQFPFEIIDNRSASSMNFQSLKTMFDQTGITTILCNIFKPHYKRWDIISLCSFLKNNYPDY